MQNLTRRAFAVASFALMCAASPLSAQETVRIRGTIERVEGPIFVINTRDGAEVKLTVTDNPLFVAIVKSTMADIKPGMFVGSTGMTQPDGSQKAIEVHIFPESMRGTGEGHYDWDLRPNSKMTNANVANVTSMGKDRVMTVQYKGGEKKVLVPESATVVSFQPADKGELKPGAQVFAITQRQPDGTLTAQRVNVGLKGQIPPM